MGILRDMTDDDLETLFEIQDDEVARRMAAFTTPGGDTRESYLAKWRKILADDQVTKKVIEVDGEVVGSAGAYVIEGAMEVTYWVRRDSWGRGLGTAALAELLREVTARPVWARAAADNVGSRSVLERNGFVQVCEETAYAESRGTEIQEALYRLDGPMA